MSISTSLQNSSAVIEITVQPKSSRSRITVEGDAVKVYLNSPPVDGKANSECIALIAKALGVPKTSIEIEKGEKGRKKRLRIPGLNSQQAIELLKKA